MYESSNVRPLSTLLTTYGRRQQGRKRQRDGRLKQTDRGKQSEQGLPQRGRGRSKRARRKLSGGWKREVGKVEDESEHGDSSFSIRRDPNYTEKEDGG